ncbi:MAG: photosystem II assembly protein Psb35 [Rivularia sp. (in: cyanobacteria)]
MFILIEITTNPTYTKSLQISLLAITVGGFLFATILGSIAWYISKRPAGWENAQTPGWISKLTKNIDTQKKSSDK